MLPPWRSRRSERPRRLLRPAPVAAAATGHAEAVSRPIVARRHDAGADVVCRRLCPASSLGPRQPRCQARNPLRGRQPRGRADDRATGRPSRDRPTVPDRATGHPMLITRSSRAPAPATDGRPARPATDVSSERSAACCHSRTRAPRSRDALAAAHDRRGRSRAWWPLTRRPAMVSSVGLEMAQVRQWTSSPSAVAATARAMVIATATARASASASAPATARVAGDREGKRFDVNVFRQRRRLRRRFGALTPRRAHRRTIRRSGAKVFVGDGGFGESIDRSTARATDVGIGSDHPSDRSAKLRGAHLSSRLPPHHSLVPANRSIDRLRARRTSASATDHRCAASSAERAGEVDDDKEDEVDETQAPSGGVRRNERAR